MATRILLWVIVAICIALVLPRPIPPQRGNSRDEFERVSDVLQDIKSDSDRRQSESKFEQASEADP